jgi:hypothetical protein
MRPFGIEGLTRFAARRPAETAEEAEVLADTRPLLETLVTTVER